MHVLEIFFYHCTGVEIKILHVLKKNVFFNYSLISRSGIIYIYIYIGYEFLPTPELELFVVEFLIGIICGGIFTNARVGIIRVVIFNWNYLWWNIY